MKDERQPKISIWAPSLAAVIAILNGGIWFIAWMTGLAGRWSASGFLTVKTNMALALLLSAVALLFLRLRSSRPTTRTLGITLGSVVLLIGGLTFLEHVFGLNLGIDQLLAREQPGAIVTTSPNRMGLPGCTSLSLI